MRIPSGRAGTCPSSNPSTSSAALTGAGSGRSPTAWASRPTTPESPVFKVHDVLHYCVPNMTANVPRTASRVLANAALPYVVEMANNGVARALGADEGLAAGTYVYRGKMVNEKVGKALDVPVVKLGDALQEG